MENIIFVGAHPDDFSACCGTALRLKEFYNINIWDFTRGERGLLDKGISMEECAAMRTREEENVGAKIGAKVEFLGEIDGEAYASRERCEYMAEMLKELKPRAIFTHFVPDVHTDHIMTTAAVLKAVWLAGINPEIYFYEYSHQSRGFIPDITVNISSVMDKKLEIIRTYESQNPNDYLADGKRRTNAFRGRQNRCTYAETFKHRGFIKADEKLVFDCLK